MSARSSPGLRSSPSSSASSRSPSSTLNSNAYDRLRFLLDALTKPVQLPILHQQRAEERLSAASSSSSPSPALSSLSAPSALLRSQARLKAGYVDWDDGLSQVKAFVRERDDGAARVWALLSERLRVRNSESRLLAFFVVDALFVRSAKFRTLALDGLHGLLEHCAGIAASSSTLAPVVAELPPPAEVAKGLKDECVAAVTRWRARYGGAYRVLELGYKYLVDALGLEHVVAAQQREGDERKAAAAHEAEVLRVRFQRMREEWKEKKADMDDCIATIDGCVDVLFPPEDDWTAETAQAETEEKKREEVVEQVIIESGPQEAGSAASTASADVVWEDDEDKEQKAPRAPEAGTVEANGQATSAAVLADDDAGQDEHEQWEDEFLRTGGSGEVWGDGSGASDGGGDDDAPEGDVGRLVAEAGLGSRGYQLEIDFDSDLGRMENEGNRVVFETLRDCCRLIQRTYLPLMIEWADVLSAVRPRPGGPSRGEDDSNLQVAAFERERSALTATVEQLISRMQAKVVQCAQLSIHVQRGSTVASRLQSLPSSTALDPSPPRHSPSSHRVEDDAFFSALQQRRRKAVQRVTRYSRKRPHSRPVEAAVARPSAAHKKVKLATQP